MPDFCMPYEVTDSIEMVVAHLGRMVAKREALAYSGWSEAQRAHVVASYPDNRIHDAGPDDDRANFRSATPRGFARAVFEANARPFQPALALAA
jgi:hypothetical protein